MAQDAFDDINDGLISLYEPSSGEPVADIVFVHGLQGHARNTWTSHTTPSATPSSSNPTHGANSSSKESRDSIFRKKKQIEVFWPQDLLPGDCPQAQIWTWGYDTMVTKGYDPANHSTLFAHARNLLFALRRNRQAGRPLIFVAHSLGGILVKEVLRRSSNAEEEDASLFDVISSTKAVVFLGTPHRGSPGFADFGQTVRAIASGLLRVDSNAAILRALGVDSPELELGLEEFVPLWNKYNFRVKTFQESLPLAGFKVGKLSNLVVPPQSSSLGDRREGAETLKADHRGMCRFWGRKDTLYQQVGGELKDIVVQIIENDAVNIETPTEVSKETQEKCLRSISYQNMDFRFRSIKAASQDTCQWIYSHKFYEAWRNPEPACHSKGLLWLKGKPGSGKSTLMKSLVSQTASTEEDRDSITTAFFFNGRGGYMEKSAFGLIRSLLHQIMKKCPSLGSEVFCLYNQRITLELRQGAWKWTEEELEGYLRNILGRSTRRVDIFIDGLDECKEPLARQVVEFCRHVTAQAYNAGHSVNVCLASRHYPNITTANCPEIVVDIENLPDISTYSRLQLQPALGADEEYLEQLVSDVAMHARGIFLWAVFAVALLKEAKDKGKDLKDGRAMLSKMPASLEDIFRETLQAQFDEDDRFEATILWQWVCFSAKPLNILELRHAVKFSGNGPFPKSMTDWRASEDEFLASVEFCKRVTDLSRGLIEVENMVSEPPPPKYRSIYPSSSRRNAVSEHLETHEYQRTPSVLTLESVHETEETSASSEVSLGGDHTSTNNSEGDSDILFDLRQKKHAGSLESTRVQFIHESVREFFLRSGAGLLNNSSSQAAHGASHLVLGEACLNYLGFEELRDIDEELDLSRMFDPRDFGGAPISWHLEKFPLLAYASLYCVEHAGSAQRCGFDPTFFIDKTEMLPLLNILRNFTAIESSGGRPFTGFDNILLFLCREQFLETVRVCMMRILNESPANTTNRRGENALHVLIKYADSGNDEPIAHLVRQLVVAGADVNTHDWRNMLPATYAIEKGLPMTTMQLIRYGSDIRLPYVRGELSLEKFGTLGDPTGLAVSDLVPVRPSGKDTMNEDSHIEVVARVHAYCRLQDVLVAFPEASGSYEIQCMIRKTLEPAKKEARDLVRASRTTPAGETLLRHAAAIDSLGMRVQSSAPEFLEDWDIITRGLQSLKKEESARGTTTWQRKGFSMVAALIFVLAILIAAW